MFLKMLIRIKKWFFLVIIHFKSKWYDDSNRVVVGNMKDEEGNAAIKKIVELKSNKAFMFIDDSSEHKNAKCAKKILFR